MMVTAIADRLAADIGALAGAFTLGANLFQYSMHDTISRGTCVLDNKSLARSDLEILGRHGGSLQVVTRDVDVARGQALAYQIHDALALPQGFQTAALRAYFLLPRHLPLSYPRSDADHMEWSVNFTYEMIRLS